jgi:hypothetical protein
MAASPKEYREFAQDCLRWAAETKSETHRLILLEMAKTWMQAALEVECSLGRTDDLPMPTHRPAVKPPTRNKPRLLARDAHCPSGPSRE